MKCIRDIGRIAFIRNPKRQQIRLCSRVESSVANNIVLKVNNKTWPLPPGIAEWMRGQDCGIWCTEDYTQIRHVGTDENWIASIRPVVKVEDSLLTSARPLENVTVWNSRVTTKRWCHVCVRLILAAKRSHNTPNHAFAKLHCHRREMAENALLNIRLNPSQCGLFSNGRNPKRQSDTQ